MMQKNLIESGLFELSDNLIGSQKSVPQNVSYLAKKANTKVDLTEIGFLWNPIIQHLRITNYQEPSYYEEYFMTTSYSSAMQQLQSSQCTQLTSHLAKQGILNPSLVEIGCGDGSFLKHASNHFFKLFGIEPSKIFAQKAASRGFKIINDYVTSKNCLLPEKVDSFVSRQVFEHLPDPLDCLIGIRKMINTGGVGLIEVPNGYQAFKNGNFYEFFPDHVNYFSVNSLVSLATSAGFNVISCNEAFGGDYLELWVRNDSGQDSWVDLMNAKANTILNILAEWSLSDQSKKRAIFGCGAKTLSMIAKNPAFFNNAFSFVIDSDPNKQSKFVPNTGLPVVSLENAAHLGSDQILILALSYVNEIVESINRTLSADIEVFTIDFDGNLINVTKTQLS
jgi:novobiocin biosynthesis protein NovU